MKLLLLGLSHSCLKVAGLLLIACTSRDLFPAAMYTWSAVNYFKFHSLRRVINCCQNFVACAQVCPLEKVGVSMYDWSQLHDAQHTAVRERLTGRKSACTQKDVTVSVVQISSLFSLLSTQITPVRQLSRRLEAWEPKSGTKWCCAACVKEVQAWSSCRARSWSFRISPHLMLATMTCSKWSSWVDSVHTQEPMPLNRVGH